MLMLVVYWNHLAFIEGPYSKYFGYGFDGACCAQSTPSISYGINSALMAWRSSIAAYAHLTIGIMFTDDRRWDAVRTALPGM
jgi:hypothetical protein